MTAPEAASLLVIATVTARAEEAGVVRLVVDGVARGASFPVGSRTTLIPIAATISVDGGEHEVTLASEDAEILSQSLTVLVSEAEDSTPSRRRAARH